MGGLAWGCFSVRQQPVRTLKLQQSVAFASCSFLVVPVGIISHMLPVCSHAACKCNTYAASIDLSRKSLTHCMCLSPIWTECMCREDTQIEEQIVPGLPTYTIPGITLDVPSSVGPLQFTPLSPPAAPPSSPGYAHSLHLSVSQSSLLHICFVGLCSGALQ